MKTARMFHFTLLMAGVLSCAGCSGLVRSGGKYEADFFHDGATVATVHQQLGKPVHTQTFAPPILLKDAPDLASYTNRFISPRLKETPVGSREDYRYRGWIREPGDNVSWGMFVGCTSGLGEIIAFPASIVERAKDSVTSHTFQVWYSPDGHYIFHRRIDADNK